MSLQYYKKREPKIKTVEEPKTTVADILDRFVHSINQKIKKIKPLALLIPFILIMSGLSIVYSQLKPYAAHFIQSQFSDNLDQGITTVVPESYEKIRSTYIYDPGVEYFSDIVSEDKVDEPTLNYQGTFYLTIDSIQIHDAPVKANVDSTSPEKYEDALSKGLAHFKGTCLPGQNCNSLIYGHSAAGDYAEKHPEDVVTAFTRLFKLNIGDEISIKVKDEEYKYTVKKVEEVFPENTEVVSNNSPNSLTLMTCSPPGLSTKRLIIIAVRQ